jgi:hypothetical protein
MRWSQPLRQTVVLNAGGYMEAAISGRLVDDMGDQSLLLKLRFVEADVRWPGSPNSVRNACKPGTLGHYFGRNDLLLSGEACVQEPQNGN